MTTMLVRSRSAKTAAVAALTALLLGCQHDSTYEATVVQVVPAPYVVFALTTDLSVPQDIDSVRVERVNPDLPSATWWSENDELGARGLSLPTDVTLPPPLDTSDPRFRYRVKAWQGATPVIFAEGMVNLPASGRLIVDQPLERSCYGWVVTSQDGGLASSCPDEQACRGGSCVPIDRTHEQAPPDAGGADAR